MRCVSVRTTQPPRTRRIHQISFNSKSFVPAAGSTLSIKRRILNRQRERAYKKERQLIVQPVFVILKAKFRFLREREKEYDNGV